MIRISDHVKWLCLDNTYERGVVKEISGNMAKVVFPWEDIIIIPIERLIKNE